MELENIIENYFAEKKDNDFLINLIEAKLKEGIFSTPEITPSVGSGRSPYREDFDVLMSSPFYHALKDNLSFPERLNIIKKYLNPKGKQDLRTDEFLATFIFLQEFDKILREYEVEDPRQAGFKFETLITVLFNGIQLNGIDITDALIDNKGQDRRLSYKFYKENRKFRIEGSLYNFLKMMAEDKDIIYFICLKNPPRFNFYSFLVNPTNFFSVLKKNTFMYNNFFEDFKNDEGISGQELAKLMVMHMESSKLGKRREETTTELFDYNFLSKVYQTKSYQNTAPEFGNITYEFQGDITISSEIIHDAKMAYSEHELGKIGNLLEDVNALNSQMMIFFSTGGNKSGRTNILNNIDIVKETFKGVTKQ